MLRDADERSITVVHVTEASETTNGWSTGRGIAGRTDRNCRSTKKQVDTVHITRDLIDTLRRMPRSRPMTDAAT